MNPCVHCHKPFESKNRFPLCDECCDTLDQETIDGYFQAKKIFWGRKDQIMLTGANINLLDRAKDVTIAVLARHAAPITSTLACTILAEIHTNMLILCHEDVPALSNRAIHRIKCFAEAAILAEPLYIKDSEHRSLVSAVRESIDEAFKNMSVYLSEQKSKGGTDAQAGQI